MNKKLTAVLVFFLVIAMLAFAGCTGSTGEQAPASEKTVYIVGIDGEYPHYAAIDKDGNPYGFDVESIEWIADKMGFEVEIKPMAWDSIIPSLNAGKIDMVYSGMTITDDRKEMVNFSIPYWQVNQAVAAYKDSGLTIDDIMAGKARIGVQRGTTGQEWVEKALIETGIMDESNLVGYDNFPLVATDLQNKRIDAAVYDVPPMIEAIEGKPLEIIGEIETGEEYGIAVRKSDAELLNTLNTGLELLMNDPYWEELKQKYNMAS